MRLPVIHLKLEPQMPQHLVVRVWWCQGVPYMLLSVCPSVCMPVCLCNTAGSFLDVLMPDAAAFIGTLVYSPACHVMSNRRLVMTSVGDNTAIMVQCSQTQAGLLLASKHVLDTDLQIAATN